MTRLGTWVVRVGILVSVWVDAHAQSTTALDWELEGNLPTRANFSLTHHAQMGVTVVFGGNMEQLALSDTWLWDGVWRRATTPSAPSARYQHVTAYDSARARIVLFGGRDESGMLGDTWAFDGNGWTQLTPAASPPPRRGHFMAYDAGRDRIVMVGGQITLSGQPAVDMWEFDGATWTLDVAGSDPTARGYLVYDSARQEMLSLNSTGLRAWDGVSWQPRNTVGLPAGANGPLLYDAAGQRVLSVHPNVGSARQAAVYAWQGDGWSQIGSPILPPGLQQMEFDGSRQHVLAVDISTASTGDRRSHTWVLDAMVWQRVFPGLPRGRAFSAMAYDARRGRAVLHGGGIQLSGLFDTLELEDHTWFLGAANLSGPASRVGHTLVFDENRAVSVMIGGAQQLANYVMEWSGSGEWVGSSPSFAAPGRRYHSSVFDSQRGRTLIFGGESLQPALGDLWAWSGQAWTELTPAVGPPARRLAGMSYDRARDRVVLFGGTNGASTFGDTWEFDGATWSQLEPSVAPPPRSAHVQVYDPRLQRTILYGGANTTELYDTWLWDGATWSQLATAHHPDAAAGACAAYDSVRREVVLFGGSTARGELWRLRDVTRGGWITTGQGCESGNGLLTLSVLDPLAIGATTRFELTHVPDTFYVLPIAWIGFDDQQWSGVPLPVPLDILGSPDCLLRTEPIAPLFLAAIGGGVAVATLSLPPEPSLVDDMLFLQGFAWDFSTARISTANLLNGHIGVR